MTRRQCRRWQLGHRRRDVRFPLTANMLSGGVNVGNVPEADVVSPRRQIEMNPARTWSEHWNFRATASVE